MDHRCSIVCAIVFLSTLQAAQEEKTQEGQIHIAEIKKTEQHIRMSVLSNCNIQGTIKTGDINMVGVQMTFGGEGNAKQEHAKPDK